MTFDASYNAMTLCYDHLDGLVKTGKIDQHTIDTGLRLLDTYIKEHKKEASATKIHVAFWDLWEYESGYPPIVLKDNMPLTFPEKLFWIKRLLLRP